MNGKIVVGMQWGDEGKGKMVDLLSANVLHVARAQGGNNAGHTINVSGRQFKLHLIPSGVLYPNVQCYIGAGTLIDPDALSAEISTLQQAGIQLEGRLWIDPRAHQITAAHREADGVDPQAIGTTGRGIGPAMADRVNRIGKPIGEDQTFVSYFAEVDRQLDAALKRGENVLLEGAQGAFLDLTFGTYPYVTSSCTLASGACAGVGLGPNRFSEVIGVAKAYTTRVGNGPFPTEGFPLDAEEIGEFGTTTGRPRRLGWLDVEMLRSAIRWNGITKLALTKLDILDRLPSIKISVGSKPELLPRSGIEAEAIFDEVRAAREGPYGKHMGDEWREADRKKGPATDCGIGSNSGSGYEELPGWESDTSKCRTFDDLPGNAKAYVNRIAHLVEVPIGWISVGPEREATITC